MAWYSLFPASLSFIEAWAIRIFALLAIAVLAPWLTLLIYDFTRYVILVVYHEVPVVGGRAQGARRPRRPSLYEREDGSSRIQQSSEVTAKSATGVGRVAGGLMAHLRTKSAEERDVLVKVRSLDEAILIEPAKVK